MDYKNWKPNLKFVNADEGTIERALARGEVIPKSPSASDLTWAAEWLSIYVSADHQEIAQAFGNVIAFLDLTAESKVKRSALAKAKREYAKEKGIKVSQVRIKKA